jgi:GNAT superfamily N-acetyltransferase
VASVPGVSVRTFGGDHDIDVWLGLRERAFAAETPAVRPWSRADFAAEFLDKWWWSAERMWFAEADGVIGSVTLGVRGRSPAATSVVHWLMVVPEWRRRGVGRLLVTCLERACWEQGERRTALESHTGWAVATAFYRSLGYR